MNQHMNQTMNEDIQFDSQEHRPDFPVIESGYSRSPKMKKKKQRKNMNHSSLIERAHENMGMY